jgi:hypothetical protein
LPGVIHQEASTPSTVSNAARVVSRSSKRARDGVRSGRVHGSDTRGFPCNPAPIVTDSVDWPVTAVYVAGIMINRLTRQGRHYPGLHWLLVCLLLLGQTLALAHDHDAAVDTETHCALCHFAHHAEGMLPGQACGGSCPYPHVFHQPLNHDPVCIAARSQYHSRAPPAILL